MLVNKAIGALFDELLRVGAGNEMNSLSCASFLAIAEGLLPHLLLQAHLYMLALR